MDINEKIVIFRKDDGGVALVIPTSEGLAGRTMEEFAQAYVPEGKPWKVISRSEVPQDRTFRDAWEYSDD